jgi:hypothetical protein
MGGRSEVEEVEAWLLLFPLLLVAVVLMADDGDPAAGMGSSEGMLNFRLSTFAAATRWFRTGVSSLDFNDCVYVWSRCRG